MCLERLPPVCTAVSWSLSDDGLIYEFVLRKDAKFHNVAPIPHASGSVGRAKTAAGYRGLRPAGLRRQP
jgi:hypothetical protein